MRITHCTGIAAMIALALLLLVCRSVGAQSVGDRVRVTMAKDMLVGQLAQVSGDGFVVALKDGRLREVAHIQIKQLELHTGKKRLWSVGRGVWGGATVGALLGLVVAGVAGETEEYYERCDAFLDWLPCEPGKKRDLTDKGWSMVGGLTFLGFVIGVVGSTETDKWKTISHEDLIGLTLSPVLDIRPSLHGGSTVVLGTHVRF